VRARRAEVAISDGDRQHYRQNVHQKREQQVTQDYQHTCWSRLAVSWWLNVWRHKEAQAREKFSNKERTVEKRTVLTRNTINRYQRHGVSTTTDVRKTSDRNSRDKNSLAATKQKILEENCFGKEREEQVLGDERDVDGRRRKNLGDQQQEDDKGEKN